MSENLNMDQFNPKKAELIALANEKKPLLSVDIVDSKSRQLLHEAKMTLANTRIEIRKTGKAMRESAIQWQKDVIKMEDELVNETEPTEKALAEKIKAYDDAIEAKKELDRKAKEELANNRNQELAKYGYVHDLFDLKIMEEDKFQELVTEKKIKWEESEKIRIENERIEAEKKEELEKQRIAQEERDRELKAREDAIRAKEQEQKRIEDELKRKQELEEAKKQAEKDTEERLKREQADKEAREKALAEQKAEQERKEQIKMAKLQKYREFCESIGYKKEEDHLWVTKDTEKGREFYKII